MQDTQGAESSKVLSRLIIAGLLFGSLMVGWWAYTQSDRVDRLELSIEQQARAIEDLRESIRPFETARPANLLPIQSGKTPTELQRPRGPQPVSVLTLSNPLPGEPPPGTDVTSQLPPSSANKADPCSEACDRLSQCVLDVALCPGLDTRLHDQIGELCHAACTENPDAGKRLAGVTDCKKGLEKARTLMPKLVALCSSVD